MVKIIFQISGLGFIKTSLPLNKRKTTQDFLSDNITLRSFLLIYTLMRVDISKPLLDYHAQVFPLCKGDTIISYSMF